MASNPSELMSMCMDNCITSDPYDSNDSVCSNSVYDRVMSACSSDTSIYESMLRSKA